MPKADERILELWHQLGAVKPEDLVGAAMSTGWRRLLSASFVHAGMLHIALNMFGLYMVGRQVERTWKRWQFLVIYLISAWGAVCISQAEQFGASMEQWRATPTLGASGAVCGMIGAEIVWVLVNRRLLPPSLRKRAYAGLVINLIVLAMFTLIPGTGTWGHFGGLGVGAVVALLLHWQRFGPELLRGPALLAVVLVPVGVFFFLRHAQNTQPFWQELQDDDFRNSLPDEANKVTARAWWFFESRVGPQLDRHPTRRDAAVVTLLLPEVAKQRDELAEVVRKLELAGQRFDEDLEAGRLAGCDYARALSELLELTEECLRAGDKWTRLDEARLTKQTDRTTELRKAWRRRLERK
jgi:membrane associated rhomboid family serine protease